MLYAIDAKLFYIIYSGNTKFYGPLAIIKVRIIFVTMNTYEGNLG